MGYVLGVGESPSVWHSIGVGPIFFWELILGLWMTFKGFNRSAPILAGIASDDANAGSATIGSRAIGVKAGAA